MFSIGNRYSSLNSALPPLVTSGYCRGNLADLRLDRQRAASNVTVRRATSGDAEAKSALRQPMVELTVEL
jgi:hypothetical protein